jgi:hypothetical protein
MRLDPADRWIFPPLARVQIEQLACCEPAGIGLQMTHWSSRSLAGSAVAQGIVPSIAHSTVALILRQATLQPHRYRYWKTPCLDAKFVERASRILWCYEQVQQLVARGEVVICFDEKPNIQALERWPTRALQPGHIEQQEFEYARHGTVNFAVAMLVHSGQMRGWCLEKNDSMHLAPVLESLFEEFKSATSIDLIWDGGPSHISHATQTLLESYGQHVRVLFTPAHASWLNQGELLLRAFGERYLKRGEWPSRQALVQHLDLSWQEYNHLFAHPFTWSWTQQDMSRWVNLQTK